MSWRFCYMRWDIPIEKSLLCLSRFADKLVVQKPRHVMKPKKKSNSRQGFGGVAVCWGSLHSEGFRKPRWKWEISLSLLSAQEGKSHSRQATEGPHESLQGLHSSKGLGVNPSTPCGMQTSGQLWGPSGKCPLGFSSVGYNLCDSLIPGSSKTLNRNV